MIPNKICNTSIIANRADMGKYWLGMNKHNVKIEDHTYTGLFFKNYCNQYQIIFEKVKAIKING
jgi:hypothetical protein